jgi:hypothetical protein
MPRTAMLLVLLGCGSHAPATTTETAVVLPAHPEPAPPKPELRDDKGHTPSEWIALGDEAFTQTKLVDAERFYHEALRAGDPDTSAYAYYKLGFVRWNQNDGASALDAFVHAIRGTNAKVASQAMRDILPVYAQYGRPEAAYSFFRTLAPDPITTLVRLEREYEDQGNTTAAKKIHAEIAAHP